MENRKAHYEYYILQEYTAGMQLLGSEVKSLRNNDGNINDCYVYIKDNEVYVKGMYIAKYKQSSYLNHEEVRDRKLLLNKKEIRDIQKELKVNGITIIPLSVFTIDGRFKIKIGIAKGKKNHDKRSSIKSKDITKQTNRDLTD